MLLDQFASYKQSGRKALAILIDPDKADRKALHTWVSRIDEWELDLVLLGGSLTVNSEMQELVPWIKSQTQCPVVLFPGNLHQVIAGADGILLLSLISGRNPDLLIGRHVEAAPLIREADLLPLPTGYMLIEAGNYTTVNYMSHTLPIPREKPEIAVCTALAGEMLGLRLIYMDGGSGAKWPVPPEMIRAVSNVLNIPLIIGGGIRSGEQAKTAWEAGADMLVVGSAIEQDPSGGLIDELITMRNQCNAKTSPASNSTNHVGE